ncbi:hypothetical protein NW767_014629 [Fusarium falciforme]|nr:hypothetical protein NW767_014629 [Fusarium falciforme]
MFFSPNILPRLLFPYISDRKSEYGHDISHRLRDPNTPNKEKKRVIVEFSSPNVARDFDGNHFRSTLLGAFVANLYEAMGWEVIRLNYLGDWGKQIGVLAAGFQTFGSEEKLEADGIRHLLDVSAKIEERFKPEQEARDKAKHGNQSTAGIEGKGIFAERDAFVKKLEENDPEALALWKRFRDITIDNLGLGYKRLGVNFDEFSGESRIQQDIITEVENMLKENGVLEESEGSWIIDFVKHAGKKGLGTQIARGRDGSTRYLLRDIAAVLDRSRKFSFDKMIYVVSSRQDNHFQQLFTAVGLLGRPDLKDKLQHISFGPVHGLEGSLLNDILDQSAARIHESQLEEQSAKDIENHVEAVSDEALMSALLVQEMSGRRGHGYTFESKRMVASSSCNGFILQDALSKLTDIIAELRTDDVDLAQPDYAALSDDNSADLLRLMAQFPDVVAATYKSLEPHTLLSYLFRIVDCLNMLNSEENEETEGEGGGSSSEESSLGEKKSKQLLYQSTRLVLENGMKLLGFPAALMN